MYIDHLTLGSPATNKEGSLSTCVLPRVDSAELTMSHKVEATTHLTLWGGLFPLRQFPLRQFLFSQC